MRTRPKIYGYVAGKAGIGTKVSLMYEIGCDYVYADKYGDDMANKLIYDIHHDHGNIAVIVESLQGEFIPSFLIKQLFQQQHAKNDCFQINTNLMFDEDFEPDDLDIQGTLTIIALDAQPSDFKVIGV